MKAALRHSSGRLVSVFSAQRQHARFGLPVLCQSRAQNLRLNTAATDTRKRWSEVLVANVELLSSNFMSSAQNRECRRIYFYGFALNTLISQNEHEYHSFKMKSNSTSVRAILPEFKTHVAKPTSLWCYIYALESQKSRLASSRTPELIEPEYGNASCHVMNFGGGSLTCCLDEQCGYALHERANAHARRYCGRCVYRAAESFRVAAIHLSENPLRRSTLLSGAGCVK
ncbi:Hypothetical_protein [Hexamita inflata]|uniref:Hypothetical_protein n=1 Tax=Hexamita inflata TaxID=28002 RepID=A0AA86PDP0_9EUKA|nr:Hypothetical protein HINF_LOCUS24769 [Hexamita inflata]